MRRNRWSPWQECALYGGTKLSRAHPRDSWAAQNRFHTAKTQSRLCVGEQHSCCKTAPNYGTARTANHDRRKRSRPEALVLPNGGRTPTSGSPNPGKPRSAVESNFLTARGEAFWPDGITSQACGSQIGAMSAFLHVVPSEHPPKPRGKPRRRFFTTARRAEPTGPGFAIVQQARHDTSSETGSPFCRLIVRLRLLPTPPPTQSCS